MQVFKISFYQNKFYCTNHFDLDQYFHNMDPLKVLKILFNWFGVFLLYQIDWGLQRKNEYTNIHITS